MPQERAGFVDRVQAFLGRLNGRMGRFPVPAGTPEGDRSVKEAVAAGLAELIRAHEPAIAGFGEDIRPDTLERAAYRIRKTKLKLEGYAEYLAEERGRLKRELTAAARSFRARVEALAAAS